MKIVMKTGSKMVAHFGLACFDETRSIIHPVQVIILQIYNKYRFVERKVLRSKLSILTATKYL